MNEVQKALLEKMAQYVVKRLKEPVTWVQMITAVATIIGIQVKPEWMEIIGTAGVAVAGAIGAALPTPVTEAAPAEVASAEEPKKG